MKKIVSLLLVISLLFGMFGCVDLPVLADDNNEIINPNYVMYQASRYSDEFQTIFGASSSSYANTYFTSMRNDNALMTAISIWEGAHIVTEPSHSLESGLITKRNMYKIVLFDLFNVNYSTDSLFNTQESYVYDIATEVLGSDDIDVTELESITDTAKYSDKILDAITVADMTDVVSVFAGILDTALNLHDAINACASYQTIANMKNGTKEILTAISTLPSGSLGENFDDIDLAELKAAATECVSYFDGAYNDVLERISNGTEPYSAAIIETAFDLAMDWAWTTIIGSIPGGLAVLATVKGVMALSNIVFELDEKNRAYYQLEANIAFENAIRNIMNTANNDYKQSGNLYKAAFYMQTVNTYKNIVLLGFDYSADLVEMQASAPATQWFNWLTNDYSECINLINDIYELKSNKQIIYSQFETNILNDYHRLNCPDYNTVINGFNNQEIVKLESISLTQVKDINIGDTGYIGNYIDVVKFPENSNELFVEDFVSENEDIIKLDNYDFIEVVGSGECTIVCNKGSEFEAQITITVGSEPIEDTPYDYLNDFEYTINSDGKSVTITDYVGSLKKVIIPTYIEGKNVTSIGNQAFRYDNITSLIMPNTITSIGIEAFEYCTKLENIVLSDSITFIGAEAFEYCRHLSSIVLPNTLSFIGRYAFYDCNNLTTVTISDKIQTIEYGAFSGCPISDIIISNGSKNVSSNMILRKTIKNVYISNSVTTIKGGAFNGCDNLIAINIPQNVNSIGYGSFDNCENLISINVANNNAYFCSVNGVLFDKAKTKLISYPNGKKDISYSIPDNVKTICSYSFAYSNNLLSITIPNSVISIGENAFSYCENLSNIVIPNSVTSIDNDAFIDTAWYNSKADGCIYAGKILYKYKGTCPETLIIRENTIGISSKAFYDCDNLTSIVIPNNVTEIGDNAFANCSNLNEVTIGNSVKTIGNYAFEYCKNLTEITIPNSVTEIGYSAFSNCTNLNKIYVTNSNYIIIRQNAFYRCENLNKVNTNDIMAWCTISFDNCYSNPLYYAKNLYLNNVLINTVSLPYTSKTAIPQYAFINCASITNVTMGSGVVYVSDSAFDGCTALNTVNYHGTEEQWNAIKFESNNDALINSTVFFACTCGAFDFSEWKIISEATCSTEGKLQRICNICSDSQIKNISKLSHDLVNDKCTLCGMEIITVESNHNYASSTDERWVVTRQSAIKMRITFSDDTVTESKYDFIYIYNSNDEQIGKYSGTELASKTIIIDGNTITIRLTSDTSVTKYGFKAEITPIYPEKIIGDLDDDGILSATDLTVMRIDLLEGITIDEDRFNIYNINGDDSFDVRDIVFLKKKLLFKS